MSNVNYYVTGNTAKGLINLLDTNIKELNQIFILKHYSNKLKTELLNQLIKTSEVDHDIEILHSALGKNYLDGIILREKSIAVLSDSVVDLNNDQTTIIDLEKTLQKSSNIPKAEQTNYNHATQKAYANFATGLQIHDDLEAIYIKEMDFARADKLAEDFITKFLNDVSKQNRKPHIYRRLFGTSTSDGVVALVPELTENLARRYYLKGRAGTGKSSFMKKIANACVEHGLDVELYYCSFDPDSVDMVLVRNFDFCIFDSTDPHEFFPDRDGDVIIDLYEEAVTSGTDEKYAEEINDINSRYKAYMKKGIAYLKQAGNHLENMERNFTFREEDIEKAIAAILKKIK